MQRDASMLNDLTKVITSPVFELLVGLAVVENIKWKDAQGTQPDSAMVWARSAVKTVALVQAVAPIAPAILQAGTDIIGGFSKNIPAVAGLLAGK
jgi:hypothetical protein